MKKKGGLFFLEELYALGQVLRKKEIKPVKKKLKLKKGTSIKALLKNDPWFKAGRRPGKEVLVSWGITATTNKREQNLTGPFCQEHPTLSKIVEKALIRIVEQGD